MHVASASSHAAPVLAQPAARDRVRDELRQRANRHGQLGVDASPDHRGAIDLAVGVLDGHPEGLAREVGGGLEVEVGPRGVVLAPDELGVRVPLGVRAELPGRAGGAVEGDRSDLDLGGEVRQVEPDVLEAVGADGDPRPRPVLPVLAHPPDLERGRRHAEVRVGGPPLEVQLGGRPVVIAEQEREGAAGLHARRLDEEVGRGRARRPPEGGRPRGVTAVELPLVGPVPPEQRMHDLAPGGQAREGDVDVLDAVPSLFRRGPPAPVLTILADPACGQGPRARPCPSRLGGGPRGGPSLRAGGRAPLGFRLRSGRGQIGGPGEVGEGQGEGKAQEDRPRSSRHWRLPTAETGIRRADGRGGGQQWESLPHPAAGGLRSRPRTGTCTSPVAEVARWVDNGSEIFRRRGLRWQRSGKPASDDPQRTASQHDRPNRASCLPTAVVQAQRSRSSSVIADTPSPEAQLIHDRDRWVGDRRG